jgi:predicted dehydrogenase
MKGPPVHPVRLMTLDPGHFHAALVQKEHYPEVARRAHVYAPLGPDLIAHLGRLAGFNQRREHATSWEIEVHAGPDPLGRMLAEQPGNVVVLSGRNRGKIDCILAAVQAGLNVLADKPWVIAADDLPKLEAALSSAATHGLVVLDIMTERHEITSILQRALVNDREVFGDIVAGTAEEPAIFMESVHYLMKMVAGAPNRRPAWFFDVDQQGEGLTDVGTHLVDLVPWILFPDQSIDYRRDLQILAARRWPTVMRRADFQKVTGEPNFPGYLAANVQEDRLNYFCNTLVSYTLRGIHIKLNILWDFEAEAGAGDVHLAVFRGSRSRVEVRQGKEQAFRPELYVVPERGSDKADVLRAVRARIAKLQADYPGVEVSDQGERLWIAVPDALRIGHEAHFAQVTSLFLGYLKEPDRMPAWERPNMLAKYYVTTHGVAMSREHV